MIRVDHHFFDFTYMLPAEWMTGLTGDFARLRDQDRITLLMEMPNRWAPLLDAEGVAYHLAVSEIDEIIRPLFQAAVEHQPSYCQYRFEGHMLCLEVMRQIIGTRGSRFRRKCVVFIDLHGFH